jgi:prophage antirepressor-like protein
MKDALISFNFDGISCRIGGTPESPSFVVVDVCRVLGLVHGRQTLQSYPDDEKSYEDFLTQGGPQKLLVVNESGLNRLIFRSNKQAAKRLQKHVFSEVLPSMRRFGCYPPPASVPSDPQKGLGGITVEELKVAFSKEKSAQVKLVLLAELGSSWARLVLSKGLKTAQAIPVAEQSEFTPAFCLKQFWQDCWDMLGVTTMSYEIVRVDQVDGDSDPKIYKLWFEPFSLMKLLGVLYPDRYSQVDRSEFRGTLATSPMWIREGKTKLRKRFGSPPVVRVAWGFIVGLDKESRAYDVAQMEYEKTNQPDENLVAETGRN